MLLGVGAESLLDSAADDTVRRLHNRATKVASFSAPLPRSRHAVIGYQGVEVADGLSITARIDSQVEMLRRRLAVKHRLLSPS